MVIAKCPLIECPFVTPDLDEDSACRFLAYHGNQHVPGMFPLTHEIPHLPKSKSKNHNPKNIVKRRKVPRQQTTCGHRNNDKAGSTRKILQYLTFHSPNQSQMIPLHISAQFSTIHCTPERYFMKLQKSHSQQLSLGVKL